MTLYTREHDWVSFPLVGASKPSFEHPLHLLPVTVGITKYARDSLGDVIFYELLRPASLVKRHQVIGTLESVKASADILAPFAGVIVKHNPLLTHSLLSLENDPEGAGWLFSMQIHVPQTVATFDALVAFAGLMTREEYLQYTKTIPYFFPFEKGKKGRGGGREGEQGETRFFARIVVCRAKLQRGQPRKGGGYQHSNPKRLIRLVLLLGLLSV